MILTLETLIVTPILSVEKSIEENGIAAFLVVLFILLSPLIYWCVRFLYKLRYNHLWRKGIFPKNLEFSRDSLMEAYICLGALMIRYDRQDYRKKIAFLTTYFEKHFPNNKRDFGESLRYSLEYPIRLHTVSAWLRTNLKEYSKRLQVLYFLAGISYVDGGLNKTERLIIKNSAELLGLSPKDLDSVIGMYEQQQRRSQSRSQRKSSSSSLKSALTTSCKILGVSEQASMDEIKKAYRSLVKKHHPDRFANESLESQQLAEKRFIEIQKAYEFLEKAKFGK